MNYDYQKINEYAKSSIYELIPNEYELVDSRTGLSR